MTTPRADTEHPMSDADALCRDPFDADGTRALFDEAVAPLADYWFRSALVGDDRIPRDGPVILAANHSGTAFPWDGILLDATLWRRDGFDPSAKVRTVYEKELSFTWWMRPFGLDDFWRSCGGVDMLFDNFERLLLRGDRVLYFPEGVPGIGKGFHHRYRLQRFSTSFVLLAARHRVPVFPVYVINAEWVDPLGIPVRALDRLMQRVFGVPFFPLPIGFLGVVLPWAWYLAFPARMVFVIGEPIDVAGMVSDEGIGDLAAPDRTRLRAVADRIHARMQRELTAHVEVHGRRPYDFRGWLAQLWRGRRALHRILPPGWPIAFVKHARDRRRPPARNRLHAVLRDLDLAAFWLPFGWPLLTLARRLRRPPYGYRGVDRAGQNEREGRFVWRLSERPLPPRVRTVVEAERAPRVAAVDSLRPPPSPRADPGPAPAPR